MQGVEGERGWGKAKGKRREAERERERRGGEAGSLQRSADSAEQCTCHKLVQESWALHAHAHADHAHADHAMPAHKHRHARVHVVHCPIKEEEQEPE